MIEDPSLSVCWMISMTGNWTCYWYRDEKTGLIGWTTIAAAGMRFPSEEAARAEVRGTVGYNEMDITEHAFMSPNFHGGT